MNEMKSSMMRRARETYRSISPCSTMSDFSECFTVEGNKLCFWFNTDDNSTHVMVADIK